MKLISYFNKFYKLKTHKNNPVPLTLNHKNIH